VKGEKGRRGKSNARPASRSSSIDGLKFTVESKESSAPSPSVGKLESKKGKRESRRKELEKRRTRNRDFRRHRRERKVFRASEEHPSVPAGSS
jgi:hypothetical protein